MLLIEPLNSLVDHAGCYLTSCVEGLKLVKEINCRTSGCCSICITSRSREGNIIRTAIEAGAVRQGVPRSRQTRTERPGHGRGLLPNVYQGIKKTGYTGYIGMEYHPLADHLTSFTKAVKELQANG